MGLFSCWPFSCEADDRLKELCTRFQSDGNAVGLPKVQRFGSCQLFYSNDQVFDIIFYRKRD